MELALSLGQDTPKPPFCFLHHKDSGFQEPGSSSHPPVQLDLLPFSPVHPSSTNLPLTWLNEKRRTGPETTRKFPGETDFPMGFPVFRGQTRDLAQIINNEDDGHGSDEEENGVMGRKKLRLSKEQSAFLEDSFKEHSTLNPKQKIGLAKQLNLRPRQVEVWFQNRRARTKLKQTEVDCEYLRKCHEALTEENRRLQKELHELRALKASKPFYMQRPATTLTMCPSCERVATAGGAAPAAAGTVAQQDAS